MRRTLTAALVAVALSGVYACSGDDAGEPPPAGSDAAPPADGSIPDALVPTADGSADAPEDVSADAPPPSKVDVTTETLTVDGSPREYVLAVPKTYAANKSYPLVLVFHGDNGYAAPMRAYHPVDDLSGDAAIVAYTTGKNRKWDLYTAYDQNEDQKYTVALVDAVKARFSVDAARVFAIGYSSGAFFVSQLTCRRAGLFSAIVLHAGGAPYEATDPNPSNPSCAGGPAATLVFHGDADVTVAPASGDYAALFWARRNGCADSRSDTVPAPCRTHDGCPASSPSTYCLIPGHDHTVWPGSLAVEWDFLKAL